MGRLNLEDEMFFYCSHQCSSYRISIAKRVDRSDVITLVTVWFIVCGLTQCDFVLNLVYI